MASLTKQQILNSTGDIKFDNIKVPELADGDPDAYIRIKTMSAKVRDIWDASNIITDAKDPKNSKVNMANYRARLCAMCICDDDGNLLFNMEEVEALSEKSSVAIQRVYEGCLSLNQININAVEDAEKN